MADIIVRTVDRVPVASDFQNIVTRDGGFTRIYLVIDTTTGRPYTLVGTTVTAVSLGGGSSSGTNTGDVTLAGVSTYASIAGQVITFSAVPAGSVSGLATVATAGTHASLSGIGTNTHATIDTHLASTANPHSVTSAQVGLGSVTNDAQTKAAIVPNTAPNSGQLLVGNAGGTAYAPVSASGDVTITSAGVTAIGNSKVTLAQMANMATSSLIYRKTAGSGAPEVNTLATLKTDLSLTGTNSGDQTITLTGDVTGTGTGSFAATIANDAVTYAKIQNVSTTSRILGRITAGAGDVEELTAANVKTILALASTDLSDVTASTISTTFTSDGTGASASGSVTVTYAKVGNFLTINIPAFSAGSGTGTPRSYSSNTALPAGVRPVADQYVQSAVILNNGAVVTTPGLIRVSTGGTIFLYRDAAPTAYTVSSTCGLNNALTVTIFLA